MVSLQSSAIATSHRFGMAREALARASGCSRRGDLQTHRGSEPPVYFAAIGRGLRNRHSGTIVFGSTRILTGWGCAEAGLPQSERISAVIEPFSEVNAVVLTCASIGILPL